MTALNIPNRELPDAEFLEGTQLAGLNWDDFRVFLAIVEIGSIHRAASALDLTQPTISRRIDRLEKIMGVRLFDRDRSGTRLTDEGRRAYTEISNARFAMARATRNTQHPDKRIDGDCKLLMGDGPAVLWMPLFMNRFYELHPNIEIKLFVSHDSGAGRNEIFDIQMHYFAPVDADPISVRLGAMHFVPFASRNYIAKYGAPRTREDLIQHRLLGHTAYLVDKGQWAAWSNDAPAHSTSFLTNQSGPLVACVKNGVGIALLPSYLAVTDDDLVPLDMGLSFPLPMFMSFQRGVAIKPAVRSTVNFLKENVFNRKSMPWFADTFHQPTAHWREIFTGKIGQA